MSAGMHDPHAVVLAPDALRLRQLQAAYELHVLVVIATAAVTGLAALLWAFRAACWAQRRWLPYGRHTDTWRRLHGAPPTVDR